METIMSSCHKYSYQEESRDRRQMFENQRENKKKNIHLLNAKKCFDKLWLKDCLKEMYYL